MAFRAAGAGWGGWSSTGAVFDVSRLLEAGDAVTEASSATALGQLYRAPIVAKLPVRKPRIETPPDDRLSESAILSAIHAPFLEGDFDEAVLSAKERRASATVGGDRYPMPDKEHARLALAFIDRGHLSPDQKATVRARAHKVLGDNAPAAKAKEADRGGDGKFKSGAHTTAAREHILAASIAIHSKDNDEANRRIESALIHTSHSQHAQAPDALKKIQAAKAALPENPSIAQGHLDTAYSTLEGEPNRLLQMKKTRESDTDRTRFRETLTFIPKFIESSFNAEKGTVDVIIIDEGQGNSRDKHNYLGTTIKEAVRNGIFEGEQAYADHPSRFDDQNRPERSIRDLIGYYFNSRECRTKNGIGYAATLKIQEGQDWVKGLIKEAIDFQNKFPDKQYVGISINADGDTVPTQRNGSTVNDVVHITEAFSADVVTKPARGGKFLKLVENTTGSLRENTALDHAKILAAATKLEEAAKASELDPAILTALAATLREEAATGKDTKANVGTSQMEAEKPTKKDDETDDQFMERSTKWAKEAEAREAAAREAVKEAQAREAATRAAGTLTESELREKYPTIFAAALTEAKRALGGGTTDTEKELATLRAEKAMRESTDIARKKLSESKLPAGTFPKMLPSLLGLKPEEMDQLIEAEAKYLESTGFDLSSKRVEGFGGKITLRESADSFTSELLVGLVKE